MPIVGFFFTAANQREIESFGPILPSSQKATDFWNGLYRCFEDSFSERIQRKKHESHSSSRHPIPGKPVRPKTNNLAGETGRLRRNLGD
jgi:hypothetical protein